MRMSSKMILIISNVREFNEKIADKGLHSAHHPVWW